MRHPRTSTENGFFRVLAVMAVAAPLLAGCNHSSPTEPTVAGVNGPWTGTYNNIPNGCDSSAQASFQYDDRGFIRGTLTAAPCLGSLLVLNGSLQGNNFTADVLNADLGLNPLRGTLSRSSLEITMFREGVETPTGQLHLHR